MPFPVSKSRLRVSAVSYLNTSPLVWGLLHGPQRGIFDLRFELPGQCADSIRSGTADIGLVPVIEVERQALQMVPGLGIASDGPVRSILLLSKMPLRQIRTMATDDSSRTSVMLSRVILAERYGVEPTFHSMKPSPHAMLDTADAALIIGDPALAYNLEVSPFPVHDLGLEWQELTGLPMVYAAWAGREEFLRRPEVAALFRDSFEFGRNHLEEIAREEAARRGFGERLAMQYLTQHIVYELGPRHYEGLQTFLRLARGVESRSAVVAQGGNERVKLK